MRVGWTGNESVGARHRPASIGPVEPGSALVGAIVAARGAAALFLELPDNMSKAQASRASSRRGFDADSMPAAA